MDRTGPDKNEKYPLNGHKGLCFLKNVITNPNIIVGDYTYYDGLEDAPNFEKNVKYHYHFLGYKLIIGKFRMVAPGVTNRKKDGYVDKRLDKRRSC